MLAPASSGPRHAKAQAQAAAAHRRVRCHRVGRDRGRGRRLRAVRAHTWSLRRIRASTRQSRRRLGISATGRCTLPVVVVGANCATLGAAGITEAGAPAYCSHLPTTNATIWSLYPGEISSPTATAARTTRCTVGDRVTGPGVHGADRTDAGGLPRRHPAEQRDSHTDAVVVARDEFWPSPLVRRHEKNHRRPVRRARRRRRGARPMALSVLQRRDGCGGRRSARRGGHHPPRPQDLRQLRRRVAGP